MERVKPALLRELTWSDAETESNDYARSLTAAERVRMVAVLTRAAWEGVGREREPFHKVISYPREAQRKTVVR